MTHSIYEENLPHEELKFREHYQRANDFCKIELFRSAREEYRAAMRYKKEDPTCQEKIRMCNANIREDANKVYMIVPVVLAVILAVILFA